MRWTLRFALPALLLLITVFVVLYIKFAQIWDQYNAPAYAWASLQNTFRGSKLENPPPVAGKVGDKVVIMAKVESEDTDWVAQNLPEYTLPPLSQIPNAHSNHFLNPSWQHAIYTVNPSSNTPNTTLTTPQNKGHESMAYLTYIIDHYTSLPRTLAFIHPHRLGFRNAWHTDTPFHSNADSLRTLNIPFVQNNGYVNLRCNWNPGCKKAHRKNKHITPEVWAEVFKGLSKASFQQPGFVPGEVGAACCAQFAVSRERVLERPKSDYEGLRRWVMETELSDAQSGRVLEFLWHVIFGMEAV
ncbi:MAG: hypothetical protein Q9223_003365 [Gallowayella weberi]